MDDRYKEGGNFAKISDLPQRILVRILRKLSFDDVAKKRRVSKEFNRICSKILNTGFYRLKAGIEDRKAKLNSKLPRIECLRKSHPLGHESEVVEALHSKIMLLKMYIGPHMEVKHCCFFPGKVLDECHKLLRIMDKNGSRSTGDIMNEIFDLSVIAIEYFRSKIEPSLPALWHIPNNVENILESVKKEFESLRHPVDSIESLDHFESFLKSCNKAVYVKAEALEELKKTIRAQNKKITKLEKKVDEMKNQEDIKVLIHENDINDILQKIEHCESVLDSFESLPKSKRLKLYNQSRKDGEGTSTSTS